jgi:hypothetical protein
MWRRLFRRFDVRISIREWDGGGVRWSRKQFLHVVLNDGFGVFFIISVVFEYCLGNECFETWLKCGGLVRW